MLHRGKRIEDSSRSTCVVPSRDLDARASANFWSMDLTEIMKHRWIPGALKQMPFFFLRAWSKTNLEAVSLHCCVVEVLLAQQEYHEHIPVLTIEPVLPRTFPHWEPDPDAEVAEGPVPFPSLVSSRSIMRDTTAIPALTSLLTSEPISDMVLLRENHLSLQPLALLVIESLYLPLLRMPTGKMHMPMFHLSWVLRVWRVLHWSRLQTSSQCVREWR